MPEIIIEESVRQISTLTDRVQEREDEGDWTGAVDGLHELLEHPCAHHQIDASEVWEDLHLLHRRAGDHDAAIDAKRNAVAAGLRSEPHPDADIAECHLLAGRRADGDALFADLRTRTPDDVWLYNAAGFAYAEVSDHRESARWFRDGIDVALRTGDPDQVVRQLADGLEAATTALGEAPEPGLRQRVDASVEGWRRPSYVPHRWDDLPPLEERACGHCGYDPQVLGGAGEAWGLAGRPAPGSPPSRRPGGPMRSTVVSVAWFPRREWEQATSRWPDLLEELPADHGEYCHRIEGHLKALARAMAGRPMRVSPLTVEGLTAYCAETGGRPDTGEGRASCAAEIARRGDAVAWPPGRNAPCWCGSGRKHKRCCGPVPAAPG